MGVLSVIGHDPETLIDCTEVLPTPASIPLNPHFPAGLTINDIEQGVRPSSLCLFQSLGDCGVDCVNDLQCASTPFPVLKTDPGPATKVAPV